MNETLVDLALVDKVWKQIERSDDDRLSEQRNGVRLCYDSLRTLLGAVPRASPRSSEDRATVNRVQVSVRTIAFVARAFGYFSAVRMDRTLTEQEKNVGQDLNALLEQADQILPKPDERLG